MPIIRGLTTLADVRKSVYGDAYLTAPTTNDTDLEAYISAATPVIEKMAGPQYAESRTLTFDGGKSAILLPHAFNTVTSVTVDAVAYTTYVADGDAGIIYAGTSTARTRFASGTQNVIIVVTVGNATVPPNVQLAARELVRYWWQQGRQANRPGVAETEPASLDAGGVYKRVASLLSANPAVGGFA